MKLNISSNFGNSKNFLGSLLDFLSGVSSWIVVISLLILAILKPVSAAGIVIVFCTYWLLRLIHLQIISSTVYRRLEVEKSTDWLMRARGLDDINAHLRKVHELDIDSEVKERISWSFHKKEVYALREDDALPPEFELLRHLVLIPVSGFEPKEIEATITTITGGSFLAEKILLVLVSDEKDPNTSKQQMFKLADKYKDDFLQVLSLIRPSLEGEGVFKQAACVTYGAKKGADFFHSKEISFEHVITTVLIPGTLLHLDHFSCLTYYFRVTPEREKVSFQPIPAYSIKLWSSSGFLRAMKLGSSFFQIADACNAGRLIPYTNFSMSLKTINEVGYWPVTKASYQQALFWKAFFHFKGGHKLLHTYVPFYLNIADKPTFMGTVAALFKNNQYKALDIENLSEIVDMFAKVEKVPLERKIAHSLKLFERSFSLAIWPFIVFLIAWIPAFIIIKEFSPEISFSISSRIPWTIFVLIFLNFIASAFLCFTFLPRTGSRKNIFKLIIDIITWPALMLGAIFLSAMPTLFSQSTLLSPRAKK